MGDFSAVTVDWTQSSGPAAILPNPAVLSSSNLGWQNVQVQMHSQPAWECPEHVFQQHVVSLHHFPARARSERSFAGRKQSEWLAEGNIVIMPANVPHKDSWDKPGRFTLLIIEPARLAGILEPSTDPARIEIVPRFAMRDGLIQHLAACLEADLRAGGCGTHLYHEWLGAALAAHLLRHHSSVSVAEQAIPASRREIARAVEFIRDNLHRNLRLHEIAGIANLSEYHFARMFKQTMGMAPHQFLIECRIQEAQKLLRNFELTADEIAFRVGFANSSHFTSHFKKATGTTPNLYRRAL